MPNANLLDPPPKEASRYSVPNLDRALSLLEVLSATPAGLTLSELAATLHIPTNSVFRISRTLEERGYLERQEATKRFCLTQKLLRLSCGPVSGNVASRSALWLRCVNFEMTRWKPFFWARLQGLRSW